MSCKPKKSSWKAVIVGEATDGKRYIGEMKHRRCGRSGLDLPILTLGFWHNFGDSRSYVAQRDIILRAFELGVSHFDLANNYGPPVGAAEECLGRLLRSELASHRDELVIATKAGWKMWPGVHGVGGGSRKHLLASLDRSLDRLGIDYVDIYYSHRPDPSTPYEETAGALAAAVHSGKALYVGISSYSVDATLAMSQLLREMGTPLLVHQPSYSMLNRWIEEEGLLEAASSEGFGLVGFTALAQGLLTGRYLDGIPRGSRADTGTTFTMNALSQENIHSLRKLNEIARGREQSLAQLALAWALRDERVTSLAVGASSVVQLEENVRGLGNLGFESDELEAIEAVIREIADPVDLWEDARFGRLHL